MEEATLEKTVLTTVGVKKVASPKGKAAALAARQAEEEALELQKLTAPHIPGCSPEWQQFYLKVRKAARTVE
ncbi:hypothetical protein D3C81_2260490 [compost metagenome]